MWFYRRIFTSVIVCGLLFGTAFFIRLQLSEYSQKPAPDFLPNVPRYRPSRVCSSRGLVLVNSSPSHAHRRQVIRATWAHPTITQSMDISVAFGVEASGDVDIQRSLDWEAEIFGDVFQDPTVDTGTSASKMIQLLKMVRGACAPLPEFVLKADDNVFVNMFAFEELIESLETFSSSNTMWCIQWQRTIDKPRNNSTWIVLRNQKNGNVHPTFCLSTVYLMTSRTLDAIIRRHDAHTDRILLPEDVYITGMLTKEAGISLSELGERLATDSEQNTDMQKIAFAYMGQAVGNDTEKLWRSLIRTRINEKKRPDLGL